MKSQAITGNFTEANAEALAVAVFKDEKATSGVLKDLDKLTGGAVTSFIKTEEFKGDKGEFAYFVIDPKGKVKAKRLLLVGSGEKGEYSPKDVALVSGAATRFLRKKNVKTFALFPRISEGAEEISNFAAQGVVTSQFELDKYRTRDKNSKAITGFSLFIEGAKTTEVKKGLTKGQAIGEAMNFTRDLANEPPNILTPTEMANRAKKMAREFGLKCEIFDEAKMEKMGMNTLLSVSRGSDQPARLIVLRYTPKKSTAKKGDLLALVGKGVTFDTGGISIKPASGMEAMKYDMTGGATVLGTMQAIAATQPSIPVMGIVGAVENMPGSKASRPSDVVKAYNGKTVEILNTDAEGRLVLADAVAYAEKQGANRIIDMATLTGAVIIALGDINTGVMGNDQELVDEIISCGKEVGENYWQLPIGKEYSRGIKSEIADVKNIGPARKAGTIIGGVFIQEFIDKAKWSHLDIAGTAWADETTPHQSKGPTGVAVRTLLRLVEKSQ
ncbi:MAG: leucyl aminopeptidase [Pyrinomonadaceae bacterium]